MLTAYAFVLLGWHLLLSHVYGTDVADGSRVGRRAESLQRAAQPLAMPSAQPEGSTPAAAATHAAAEPTAALIAATPAVAAAASEPTAGTCIGKAHVEYDGAVMVPGMGPGATVSSSPAECCALCADTRGCNIWVACTHEWCRSQCWLKWIENPDEVQVRAANAEVPWTSGVLMKDMPSLLPPPDDAKLSAIDIVTLKTTAGDLRIRLKPEWHLPSVTFVREAALSDTCTVKCEFYRAEPGFLLQGAMRAVVRPNKRCRAFKGGPEECTDPQERPGGSMMEAFDVAWAGGSAGPDFFIMMARNGFGASHTVWGRLADEASMALARQMVQGASNSPRGTMRMLSEPVRFTMIAGPS